MYYLIYLVHSNSYPNYNMKVKAFTDILDLYAFGMDNHFFRLGPGTYVIITPDGIETAPGDIYAEIERIQLSRAKKSEPVSESVKEGEKNV